MRMSCNGCRVLRKGCSESCILRPCLEWIKSAQSQANATAFLAKFYGRTGLINLISNGPHYSRPALFRSLLYEACGRILNPIYGSVGLLWSGNWAACQAGVESILHGMYPVAMPNNANPPDAQNEAHHTVLHGALMQSIASELHKVKARGKFKCVNSRRKPISKYPQVLNSGIYEGKGVSDSAKDKCSSELMASQGQNDLGGGDIMYNRFHTVNPEVEALYVQNSEVQVELELQLTLGGQGDVARR